MGNPFLDGNFAPVHQEITSTQLDVVGTIPEELDGRYVRIGPNPVREPDPRSYHWFLGDGMVHGVRLRGGRAEWYRNRWVRSASVADALGEPRRPGPVHGGLDFAANTNVIGQAGRTLALVEAGPVPYELTEELETVGPCDFDGTLPGGYTAHPHRDPVTGEWHAVSYFWEWGNRVRYSVLGNDGRIRRSLDVPVGGSPMMHDFSLTENYVVLYDLPVTFDVEGAAAGSVPRPLARMFGPLVARLIRRGLPAPVAAAGRRRATGRGRLRFPYRWDPHYPARIGVLRRDSTTGKDVRWFEIEPCYVFHQLNAYEDGERIVLDVIRHPRMFATWNGPAEGIPTLERWTVDLTSGAVRQECVDDRGQEFPQVDERLVGLRHRYGYSIGVGGPGSGRDTVFKQDMAEGQAAVTRSFGAGREVNEFTFVPRAPESAEDDGILMGYVYNAETGRSDLVLLDAGTLDTVATIHLPVRVPDGFHGNWLPTEEIPA
ncbi:carotenoid cleavage dioxygenase [Longimycelium tulufanense]|uniref:Dioxygenase n=1 Tax=Longimycelium tulufanense TaxID=907463 RepID=A0A8J3CE59_9PSEU|nr:carotenoid oxygenase family protein [Longimycelium tulufanense]GGM52491.1 carotenoid cleavage dioxygenase [Longimycelium tulufanense]